MVYKIFFFLIIFTVIFARYSFADAPDNATFQSQFPNYYKYAASLFGVTNAQNTTPTGNSCGHWNLYNPLHVNFGDPNCTFTKDKLYALLKQLDTQHGTHDAD